MNVSVDLVRPAVDPDKVAHAPGRVREGLLAVDVGPRGVQAQVRGLLVRAGAALVGVVLLLFGIALYGSSGVTSAAQVTTSI